MTQPPDERDPLAPDPGQPSGEIPAEEPAATPDAPTQAWSPEPPAIEPEPVPESTVGWAALPRTPDPAGLPPAPPPASPLISAEPAATPGGAANWTVPTRSTPQEVAPGLVWADTPSRFVAYVIDSFLVGIVASIVGSAFGFQQMNPTLGQGVDARSSIGLAVITTVIGAAYFILFWSGGRRATLGQMLFKIQVANAFDGQPLTTTQAVKRWIGLGNFLTLISFLPGTLGLAALVQFVWSIVLLVTTTSSPTKQGLHDKFANSAVVRPAGAGNGLAMACMVIVIGLFVLAIVSIIGLVFLGGQVSTILSTVGDSI